MKRSEVVVEWKNGLHARPASKLVQIARKFNSEIRLQCNDQVANARSILGVLLLCATLGATIQLEVVGDDEDKALHAVEQIFTSPDE